MADLKAPYLWSLRDHPVRLLGTLHAGLPGGFSTGKSNDVLLDSAKELWLEIDPLLPEDVSLLYRRGGRLVDEIGNDNMEALRRVNCPPQAGWDAFQAGAASVFIQLNELFDARVLTAVSKENGLDRALAQRYRAQRKPVQFLETPEDQCAAAIAGPPDEIMAELDTWRQQCMLPRASEAGLCPAYLAGDDDALVRLRRDWAPQRPGMCRALFNDREDRWLERIRQIVASGEDSLVAAGVLHFVGPDGLAARVNREYPLARHGHF